MFEWISSLVRGRGEGQGEAGTNSPYAAVKVGFNGDKAWCHWPGREPQSVRWGQLMRVAVETRDEDPSAEDVWWHLASENGVVTYPSEASGADDLLDRLQKIPTFNNERLIEAMTSVENQTFILWDNAGRHE